jgi:uncharacterized protein
LCPWIADRARGRIPGVSLPATAAWRHHEARDGFEVVFLRADGDGYRIAGHTAAVEDGEAWAVEYDIRVDGSWRTRCARVRGRSAGSRRERTLEADGAGGWLVDGAPVADLDGCLDVDLESSSLTNAFPVQRLALAVGEAADAPAAYVRAGDLAVARLEQRYVRLADGERGQRFDYTSPAFDFRAVLAYDEHGLALDYPGIAVRIA